MESKEGISIIICCYNSSDRLPETIKHMAQQVVPEGFDWEVIIIDNNSSDKTNETAIREWNKYSSSTNFKVVDESRPGLNFARDRGIEVSQYKFFIFCDDDNWFAPDYVYRSYSIINSNNKIGVLGGFNEPAFESESPEWFSSYQHYYAVGPQAKESGEIPIGRGYVFGAGAVFRKEGIEIIRRFGFKNLTTDRTGTSLVSGGDNELCYALIMAGYSIWYDSSLRLKHFIPTQRLNWQYQIRLIEGVGISRPYLLPYQIKLNKIHKTLSASFIYARYLFMISLVYFKLAIRIKLNSKLKKEGNIIYRDFIYHKAIYTSLHRMGRETFKKNFNSVGEFYNRCLFKSIF